MARILVADDDFLLRKLVGAHMEAIGHQCVEAANGREALEQLRADDFDLMILDHMMPLCDGPAVLREARRTPRLAQLPIVMLTARNVNEDKVVAFESGVDDYLNKPFHPGELKSRIGRLLVRRQSA